MVVLATLMLSAAGPALAATSGRSEVRPFGRGLFGAIRKYVARQKARQELKRFTRQDAEIGKAYAKALRSNVGSKALHRFIEAGLVAFSLQAVPLAGVGGAVATGLTLDNHIKTEKTVDAHNARIALKKMANKGIKPSSAQLREWKRSGLFDYAPAPLVKFGKGGFLVPGDAKE